MVTAEPVTKKKATPRQPLPEKSDLGDQVTLSVAKSFLSCDEIAYLGAIMEPFRDIKRSLYENIQKAKGKEHFEGLSRPVWGDQGDQVTR